MIMDGLTPGGEPPPPLIVSSLQVSAQMARHPRKDTGPELTLRRLLFARGLRYRVQFRVPGMARRTIDIAFPGKKVAVFLDGCFWHGCPEHGMLPHSNREWWRRKLDGNRRRDLERLPAEIYTHRCHAKVGNGLTTPCRGPVP